MSEKSVFGRFPLAEQVVYEIDLLNWSERALRVIRQVIFQHHPGLLTSLRLKAIDQLIETHIISENHRLLQLSNEEAAEFQNLLAQENLTAHIEIETDSLKTDLEDESDSAQK